MASDQDNSSSSSENFFDRMMKTERGTKRKHSAAKFTYTDALGETTVVMYSNIGMLPTGRLTGFFFRSWRPTSELSVFFLESAQFAKKVYGKMLDYSSGYVAIWMPYTGSGDRFPMDHIALLPRKNFVQIFGDPKKVETNLLAKATELAKEWKKENQSKPGQRTPCEKVFEGLKHTSLAQGKDPREKPVKETTIYELGLNTWGFTAEYMSVERPPPLTTRDIRVCGDVTQKKESANSFVSPYFSVSGQAEDDVRHQRQEVAARLRGDRRIFARQLGVQSDSGPLFGVRGPTPVRRIRGLFAAGRKSGPGEGLRRGGRRRFSPGDLGGFRQANSGLRQETSAAHAHVRPEKRPESRRQISRHAHSPLLQPHSVDHSSVGGRADLRWQPPQRQ
jgi:hypothetical protein